MFEVHSSILFIRKQDNRQICQLRDFLTRLILNKLPGKCDFQCRLSCRGKKGIRRVIDPKNKLLFASQLLPVAIFLSSRFLFLCFLIFIKIIQKQQFTFWIFSTFSFSFLRNSSDLHRQIPAPERTVFRRLFRI